MPGTLRDGACIHNRTQGTNTARAIDRASLRRPSCPEYRLDCEQVTRCQGANEHGSHLIVSDRPMWRPDIGADDHGISDNQDARDRVFYDGIGGHVAPRL